MPGITRRRLIGGGVALSGAVLLPGCSPSSDVLVGPEDDAIEATEERRLGTGRTRELTLTATQSEFDLGGTVVRTWAYGGALPGDELRVTAGDTVEAALVNELPDPTTVHWHGLALRNDMDGAPGITQEEVAPGERFTYRFIAANPGTHWFHPHVGTQLDRGLYAPLIVEDPDEALSYDEEWVVVLDDWLDGIGTTPEEVLSELREGVSRGGHGRNRMGGEGEPVREGSLLRATTSDLLGGDAGDVYYPLHLVNGHPPADPAQFEAAPGSRVRIRLLNAGGDTAYRVALGGHTMTITHADGYPVEQAEADAVLLGMGERIDFLVTLEDGVFPLVALAEGKGEAGLALVRTGSGPAPDVGVRPDELDGWVLLATDLVSDEEVRLPAAEPAAVHTFELTGGMMGFDWGVNGRPFDHGDPAAEAFTVSEGQRVRVAIRNATMMWHPIHLHGHHFQLGADGPRKDTVSILPHQVLTCDFDADNPGMWMAHCHNIYHAEVGMAGLFAYTAR